MINTNALCQRFSRRATSISASPPKRLPAVQALAGVSLEAPRGMLTALVGPDGAGKTTLIRLAAGLLHADSGELLVLGIDSAKDPQQIQDRSATCPSGLVCTKI